jgi:hypothetical protein
MITHCFHHIKTINIYKRSKSFDFFEKNTKEPCRFYTMTHAGSDFSWFFQRAPPGQRALETGKYRQIWQKKAAGESLPRRPKSSYSPTPVELSDNCAAAPLHKER